MFVLSSHYRSFFVFLSLFIARWNEGERKKRLNLCRVSPCITSISICSNYFDFFIIEIQYFENCSWKSSIYHQWKFLSLARNRSRWQAAHIIKLVLLLTRDAQMVILWLNWKIEYSSMRSLIDREIAIFLLCMPRAHNSPPAVLSMIYCCLRERRNCILRDWCLTV